MKKMLRKFIQWVMREEAPAITGYAMNAPIDNSASSSPETPHVRVGLLNVMNGKLLEVCSFKRNPHGPDWQTTYWILNDEQPVADQIGLVLAMKGLEK